MAATQANADAELFETVGPVGPVGPIGLEGPAIETAKEKLDRAKERYGEFQRGKREARLMAANGASEEEIRDHLEQNLSLQGAVITVIVAGATAYAGLNVMSSIDGTMSLASGDPFYNSSQTLQQGIGDFFTQMPTVFVVIALVLIIGYLTLLR